MNSNKKKNNLGLLLLVGVALYAAYASKTPKRKGSLIIGEPYDGEFLPDYEIQTSTGPKIVDHAAPVNDIITDVVPATVVEDSGGNITVYDDAGNAYTPLKQPYAGGEMYYANQTGIYAQPSGSDRLIFVGPLQTSYEAINGIGRAGKFIKRGNLGAKKII